MSQSLQPNEIEHKRLTEDFEKDLTTAPRYQNFFKDYDPGSISGFIKTYASKKAFWHQYGPKLIGRKEERELEWYNEGLQMVEVIKQKQLFDLQCRWRAGQIELPGMEICFDFEVWSHNIMALKFLPPITEDDVALFLAFMATEPPGEQGMFVMWQHYATIRAEYMGKKSSGLIVGMPQWYEYHNTMTGNGALMLLPDIRGEKEKYYWSFDDGDNPPPPVETRPPAETEATNAGGSPQDISGEKETENENADEGAKHDHLRHYFPGRNERLTELFIKKFETPELLDYYRAVEYQHLQTDEEYDVEKTLETFLDAGEEVRLEPAFHWTQALEKAMLQLRARKIAQFLPVALAETNMMGDIGIAEDGEEQFLFTKWKKLRESWAADIIKGRLLCGEPGDLNYMEEG